MLCEPERLCARRDKADYRGKPAAARRAGSSSTTAGALMPITGSVCTRCAQDTASQQAARRVRTAHDPADSRRRSRFAAGSTRLPDAERRRNRDSFPGVHQLRDHHEEAAAAGAFARQSRLPRAGRVATAYGTENLRPPAVVNCVTENSFLSGSLNSVAPMRISLRGSRDHLSVGCESRVLTTAAPRTVASPSSNWSSEPAPEFRSIQITLGTSREPDCDTRRTNKSPGVHCSTNPHTSAPKIAD